MTELETKIEAEAPEFTDELSDEALDRSEGAYCMSQSTVGGRCAFSPA